MYPKINELLKKDHKIIVGVIETYCDDCGEDFESKQELVDSFYDEENIPIEMTVDVLTNTLSDIVDFENYLNALPEFNHIEKLYRQK